MVESHFVEVFDESALFVVAGDGLRAWGEGGLDVGLNFDASFAGVFAEEGGGEHHAGVRGVCA